MNMLCDANESSCQVTKVKKTHEYQIKLNFLNFGSFQLHINGTL